MNIKELIEKATALEMDIVQVRHAEDPARTMKVVKAVADISRYLDTEYKDDIPVAIEAVLIIADIFKNTRGK